MNRLLILFALFNLSLLGKTLTGVKPLTVKPVLKTIQNLPKVVHKNIEENQKNSSIVQRSPKDPEKCVTDS